MENLLTKPSLLEETILGLAKNWQYFQDVPLTTLESLQMKPYKFLLCITQKSHVSNETYSFHGD